MECSGNYVYAPRSSCYGFSNENLIPHFQRMRFPLENIYQYVIASNLFVNRDLFDLLCVIIAIVGHKCELCKSAKINGALYTYISSCIFDTYSLLIYDCIYILTGLLMVLFISW